MLNPRVKTEYASALVEGAEPVFVVTQCIPELAHWIVQPFTSIALLDTLLLSYGLYSPVTTPIRLYKLVALGFCYTCCYGDTWPTGPVDTCVVDGLVYLPDGAKLLSSIFV